MSAPVLVWFRHDLRLEDHPALAAASASGAPVIPVFVLDDATPGPWAPGGASRWWLHHSLAALDRSLAARGSRLVLRRGAAIDVVPRLAAETGAQSVVFTRRYEPDQTRLETDLAAVLERDGVTPRRFGGGLVFEPEAIATKDGRPYRVFTPFYRACLAALPALRPVPAPPALPGPDVWPASDRLDDWGLLPRPDWAAGLRDCWTPGEAGASARLDAFLDGAVGRYGVDRDRPDHDGTSMLSPHLHFGEISPRAGWSRVMAAVAADPALGVGADAFLRELVWREFSYQLLFHAPGLAEEPLRPEFARFPWRDDAGALAAWQQGRTGYPYVDAGMRQLWQTGWMHNRVRMAVASFLVKHLLVPWQAGAACFWDTLVDADLANNSASWQWVAGSGADAAPYFRIFNPVAQGRKFDPDGAYVRRFVPELAGLPASHIHEPWKAPADTLRAAGVTLGGTYPLPIVDHAVARRRALEAFAAINTKVSN